MAAPLFKVEVAFADGPNVAAPTFTDISQYVRRDPALTYSRGSTDEVSGLQAGTMSFAVDNANGRFTPGSAASTAAWGTVLKIRRPVRLSIWNGSAYVVAWRGTVDDWGTGWVGGVQGRTMVSCSDIVAELGRILLNDSILCNIRRDMASGVCYTLTQAAGTSRVAASLGGTGFSDLRTLYTGATGSGSVTFGTAMGLGPEKATGAYFNPVSSTAGAYLQNSPAFTDTSLTADKGVLEAFVQFQPGASLGATVDIVNITNGTQYAKLQLNASGQLLAGFTGGGVPVTTAVSPVGVCDGNLHHIAVRWASAAGTTTITLAVDGVTRASTTTTSSAAVLTFLRIGGGVTLGTALRGTIAYVAVNRDTLSAGTLLPDHAAAITSWAGEEASARFTRLLGWSGIDSSRYAVGTATNTPMAAQPLDNTSAVSAVAAIDDAEQGSIYVTAAGVLTINGRANRYNKTSSLTIAPQTLSGSVDFVTNDTYLVNRATVTDATGYAFTSDNTTSQTAYGLISRAISAFVQNDWSVINLAQWLTYRWQDPGTRVRDLRINGTTKASSITAVQLLALDVDSRITLSPLPNPAPASSVQLFIDGLSGEIGDQWSVSFQTSPTTNLDGWVLGTGALGSTTTLLY